MTYWSNTTSTRDHSISEDQLAEQIKFLVDNIKVGNRIFRHTNRDRLCSTLGKPFSFLLRIQIHERKTKSKQPNSQNFQQHFDDLLTLNNPVFQQEISNIYLPPQLKLKKTTTDSRLSYLDLEVKSRIGSSPWQFLTNEMNLIFT